MKTLITGAGRGIGFELTKQALEKGFDVLAFARNFSKNENLNSLKKEFSKQLTLFNVDVTNSDDLQAAKGDIGSQPIDIIINNAGICDREDDAFAGLNLKMVEKTFQVNTLAAMAVAQTFLSHLEKGTTPKLVNITSQMGSIADNSNGGYYGYRMSKAALNMFSKSFSVDYKKIVTLTLHPGWVQTDMGGKSAPISPSDSASGLWKVILDSQLKNSGHFYNFKGVELPW